MSRLDRKITASDEAPLDAAEILAALEAQAKSGRDRNDAIARYLAAADDWKDASQLLGGAFAEAPNASAPGTEEGGDREINQRVSEYLQRPTLKAGAIDDD